MMSIVSHTSYDNKDPLITLQKMFEMIANVASDIETDVKACSKFRDARKLLKSVIPGIVEVFPELDLEEKTTIEDKTIALKNKSKLILNKINKGEITFKHTLAKSFMLRELRLLIQIFTFLHDQFSSHLYSKPALTTDANDPLTKKLIQAWGEHAFQNY